MEKVALESKSRRGLWLIWIFSMLSINICMNVKSFTDFEASFRILFNDKVSKNAPKHEIVWYISNHFRFSCCLSTFSSALFPDVFCVSYLATTTPSSNNFFHFLFIKKPNKSMALYWIHLFITHDAVIDVINTMYWLICFSAKNRSNVWLWSFLLYVITYKEIKRDNSFFHILEFIKIRVFMSIMIIFEEKMWFILEWK